MDEPSKRKRKRGGKRRRRPQEPAKAGSTSSIETSPSFSLQHQQCQKQPPPQQCQKQLPQQQCQKQPPMQQQQQRKKQTYPPPLPPSKRRRISDEHQGDRPSTSRLLDKMRARLSGGHFRMLNERLYTCSGRDAFKLFQKEPKLFSMYHSGYQEQMSRWPEQPVNVIIKWLKDHSSSLKVADFGCGNACLAKSVKNKVFSIDLVSSDPSVIACDMAHTPLSSASVDVAVFCLSLMGTDFPKYLVEANRVLKSCGWLLIAEVRSRLDPENGGANPEKFSKAVQKLGFSEVSKDFSNKMFVLFYFRKKETSTPPGDIQWPELKPCLYKRR